MKRLELRKEMQQQAIKAPAYDVNRHFQVAHYAEWLSAQAKQETLASTKQEVSDYARYAEKAVQLGNRRIAVFAPFQPGYSAWQTITIWQTVVFGVTILAWILGILVFRHGMLIATMAVITELYLGLLFVSVALSFSTFMHSSEEQIDEAIIHALQDVDWPLYTILCPLYHEAQVVSQFVRAMQALSYPTEKLQILLLIEEDDAETLNALRALALPSHFLVVIVPEGSPRTKPRACNYGLLQATGQYVVIYDAEDIPEPLQLKKAVLTFANHGADLGCVQARLNFYNPHQNVLTRLFTAEYALWFDLILPGLQRLRFSIPLGGTSNHFQTRTLRALGGWDAFNVTEDCDLGMRLSRYNLKTIVLNSVTYEEATSQFKDWIRQRSRWVKGYMQTYLVHTRKPFRYLYSGRLGELLSLQFVIGGKTAVLFLNPLLWLSIGIYFLLRPIVGDAFDALFPKPLLYMGTFSLIFGNFFYAYMYLIACVRRKQYWLAKWTLLVPLYWVVMSLAAFKALFQLIMKPHYWEKTKHGLHLNEKGLAQDTVLLHTQPLKGWSDLPVSPFFNMNGHSLLSSVKVSPRRKTMFSWLTLDHLKLKDPWFIATVIIACIASVASCWYYLQQQDILLYGDAYGHLRLARAVLDGPGVSFAQLGGVWLPLPHMLMLPFIWNDYLWRTGLAGSIPSMACYLVSCAYLYLAAERLTGDRCASFVGVLVFILNPNILYLQATPLSETLCIATSTAACYYFLAWVQDDHAKYLILAAGSTFLATLTRYDGWALYFALLGLIGFIGWRKHHPLRQIEGNLILFGVLGSLGMVLWLLWDAVVFDDPLYFQRGPYSSQANQIGFLNDRVGFLQQHILYTYHDLWQSVRFYTLSSIDTLGLPLVVLAVLGLVVSMFRYRFSPGVFGALAFFTPFGFYILALYTGQAIIILPEAVPTQATVHLFNVRYGAEMVAPVALFVAALVSGWPFPVRAYLGRIIPRAFRWLHAYTSGRPPTRSSLWRMVEYVAVAVFVVVESVLVAHGGIISLQDGEYGKSCTQPHEINIYLTQHYNGGKILEYVYTSVIDGLDAGVDFKNIVNEGSGSLWTAALHDPAAFVDWIVMRPIELKLPEEPPDLVAQHVDRQSAVFIAQFTLVVQEPTGLQLYHRNGLPPLPTRSVPPSLYTEHSLCGSSFLSHD